MMDFLNDKLENKGKESFLKNAALALLIADILNLIYINMYWFKERFSSEFIRSVFKMKGINTVGMSDQVILQYKYVLIGSVTNVFYLFLGVHGIIYYFFSKETKWTTKYVGGYTLSAVLLTALELVVFRNNLSPWSLLLALSAVIYLIVFKGIKYFKIQEQ